MKEETVRCVMIEYFRSKNVEAIPQRGAGPDLHIKGKGVVEMKGTKTDFHRLLRQLVDYAKKNANVGLALPFDGLDNKKIVQLLALEFLVSQYMESELKLYIVAYAPENDGSFLVRDCKDVGEVRAMMGLLSLEGLNPKDPSNTTGVAVESIIRYSPVEELKKNMTVDHRVSRVELGTYRRN